MSFLRSRPWGLVILPNTVKAEFTRQREEPPRIVETAPEMTLAKFPYAQNGLNVRHVHPPSLPARMLAKPGAGFSS